MERSISFERTARVAFEAAAAALAEQAPDIVLDDPATGTLELDASLAGFVVSRPVMATLGTVGRLDQHAVVMPLAWQAVEHPRRFPTFRGMIEISALADHPVQSQIALLGRVRAPLGVLGTIGEAAGGSQVGDAVLEALLDRIVERLVATVASRQASAAAATTPSHLSRPRFVPED